MRYYEVCPRGHRFWVTHRRKSSTPSRIRTCDLRIRRTRVRFGLPSVTVLIELYVFGGSFPLPCSASASRFQATVWPTVAWRFSPPAGGAGPALGHTPPRQPLYCWRLDTPTNVVRNHDAETAILRPTGTVCVSPGGAICDALHRFAGKRNFPAGCCRHHCVAVLPDCALCRDGVRSMGATDSQLGCGRYSAKFTTALSRF